VDAIKSLVFVTLFCNCHAKKPKSDVTKNFADLKIDPGGHFSTLKISTLGSSLNIELHCEFLSLRH
jgi:hypothetical protein